MCVEVRASCVCVCVCVKVRAVMCCVFLVAKPSLPVFVDGFL